ncbi:MAG: hypothetical protein WCR13_04105 [Sphaerochaeta sp.]
MVNKHAGISLLLSFFLVYPLSLFASENPVVSMTMLPTLAYRADTDVWMEMMPASLSLAIPSANKGNVRGEVVLKASTPVTITSLDDVVHKAYLKAKFPSFRLTMGKTRLSWGDGRVFNAADVLYGSSDTALDFTQTELRNMTTWMVSINYPIDFFSFAEAVMMPSDTTDPTDMTFGGRFYGTIQDIKVEGGYATKRESGSRVHKPYVSFQGSFGPDWYLSSSLTIPVTGDIAQSTLTSWLASAGLFQYVQLENDRSMTLRLEFLLRPFGDWDLASALDNKNCALLLYPELNYAISPSLALSFQSILSPLDLSSKSTIGFSWNVFEGFSVLGYGSVTSGEAGDVFSWNAADSFSLSVGTSWVF